MLLFLPLLGLELGALWMVLAWLLERFAAPALIRGLLLFVYPYGITGFLHLDGFMDVTDAVRSCRDLERRRQILKDPHVGSFAVIYCVILLLAGFALFSSGAGDVRVLLLLPVVSRCCAGLAVTGLPAMSTSQYAGRKVRTGHLWYFAVLLTAVLAAGWCFSGGWPLLACALGYGAALFHGYRSLGGMNGDISGYALTIGELCGAAVWALL